MRISRVLPFVELYSDARLLDIGCGWEVRLLKELEAHISYGVGIDVKAPWIDTLKLKTFSTSLDRMLPFDDASFDIVTMLAVLEHLDHPEDIMREISRILRPGGGLVLTVPSWYAKPVLEFLSYRVGIISPDEIRDHKRYFNREDLVRLVADVGGLKLIHHDYFQWRFNNLLFVTRQP
jgi:2-polyprenyl-3-methyl-5-hydroxy-6-metoxy-1,4-benzoquinol methylase